MADTQANSEETWRPDFEVAIIGAGPGGIAAAIKVAGAGIDDFVIIEGADDIGGSWHENHYPGLGVDVPAIAYQYSFARNPNWSRVFPRGAEVKSYHVDVAKRFENVGLVTAPISEITANGIRTRDGRDYDLDVIVLATGYEVFSDPETYRPRTILGRDNFDLAEYYRQHGLQAYQSVAVPGLPNRWTLVGPYSWTGSGWHAFVAMRADHAVRAISEARRRRAARAEVRQAVHDEYHDLIAKRSRALRYYFNDLNGHVSTYYRNSQGDSTYVRPTGFSAASRANRHVSFDDYQHDQARDGASLAVQR